MKRRAIMKRVKKVMKEESKDKPSIVFLEDKNIYGISNDSAKKKNTSSQVYIVDSHWQHFDDVCGLNQRLYNQT